jgi:hypothetical protein
MSSSLTVSCPNATATVGDEKNSYKKKQWRPPSKKKKRAKNLSPRNMKACHSVSDALLKASRR